MIKATVWTNGHADTNFFTTVGSAIQWVRGFAGSADKWAVFGKDDKLYYTC